MLSDTEILMFAGAIGTPIFGAAAALIVLVIKGWGR